MSGDIIEDHTAKNLMIRIAKGKQIWKNSIKIPFANIIILLLKTDFLFLILPTSVVHGH